MAACKKENTSAEPPVPQSPPAQLATSKETGVTAGQTFYINRTFVYDEQSRLNEIKFISPNNGYNVVEKYTYTGNKVLYRYYVNNAEVPSAATDYILNGSNRAEATLYPNSNTFRTSEYNSGGYITRMNMNFGGANKRYQIYHYNTGNVLDSVSEFYEDGSKIEVTVFSYETGKKNTIANGNKGIQFLSTAQAAPVKKSTVFNFQRAGMGGIRSKLSETAYTYEYDSNNRIKKYSAVETGYESNGSAGPSGVKEVMEYTYKQ